MESKFPEVERDLDGKCWALAPHELMNAELDDFSALLNAAIKTHNDCSGIRVRLPPGIGSGFWESVEIGSDLLVMTCAAEYHNDIELNVPGDRLVKIRILLCGTLVAANRDATLDGAGAHVEVFPGEVASSYVLRGGGPIKLVVIHCAPRFFTDSLGLKPAELPALLRMIFENMSGHPQSIVAPLGPDVLRAATDIMHSARRFTEPLYHGFLHAKALEIVCSMVAALTSDTAADADHGWTLRDVGRAEEARDILIDRFRRPPQIPQLAREVGVNQTKLKALFKALFGMTIHEFTQKCRMERAAELLTASDLSISEIAYAVGYDYPASFTHAFRQFYGHAPRDLRRAS